MVNLVENAVKFTDQGQVRVRLYPEAARWVIEVADTGRGIPAAAQAIIFDAFQQVDGSTTREKRGVGLGLSIVRQLTALMGGEIHLASQVGHGSTFKVSLPLLAEGEKIA
jgi:signal transduction histidine kinase